MDDFNRAKRLFKVDEVKEFITLSLDNYYEMFDSSDEFEDYEKNENASLFMININSADQTD